MLLLFQAATAQAHDAAASNGSGDVIKAVAVAAISLLGTLSTVVFGWIKERGVSNVRQKQVDENLKRVQFWEAWHKAIDPLDVNNDSPYWKEKARTEMWAAAVDTEKLYRPSEVSYKSPWDQRVALLPASKRLLLLYKPARKSAYLPRLFFWSYAALAIVNPSIQNTRWLERRSALRSQINYVSSEIEHLGSDKALADDRRLLGNDLLRLKSLESQPRPLMYWILYDAGLLVFALLFRHISIRIEPPKEKE